jgi:hypothetical protein
VSEWEPSVAVINAFENAYAMTLSTHENKQLAAIKAAVAADPLLSAAKDMQDALQNLLELIEADRILRKSRGEQ